jgi:hypothetical protein
MDVSIQFNSCSKKETPDDGQQGPKHIVRKESVRISFSMLHRDGNNIIANDLPLIKGKKQVIQQN